MSKVVWKFPLKVEPKQNLILPLGAQVLCLQNQRDIPTIWALVNPKEERREKRLIQMVGTGHDELSPSGGDYIGTFQYNHGSLVWHFFHI